MIITKYTLIRFLKKPKSFVAACIVPVVIMFIPALWDESGNLAGLSLLAFVIMGSGFVTSQTLLTDRLEGSLVRVMTAPVTKFRYLFETLMACTLPILIQLCFVTLFGFMLYGWSLGFGVSLLLLNSLFAFSSVAMSFMWYSFMKSKDNSTAGLSVLVTFMALLSGMFFPLDVFPVFFQYLGRVFPVYWVVQGYSDLLLGSSYFTATYLVRIIIVIIFTTLFLFIGSKRMQL